MMPIAQLISGLNAGMNVLFEFLKGPMQAVPAWLSLSVSSAVLGVLMLVVFKYTSPQQALGRTRNRIKANLLAMKLFRDSVPAVIRAQIRIFADSILLLLLSSPPMLVMLLPLCLVLGQLGQWYQVRPLQVGEEAVVSMQLSGGDDEALSRVILHPSEFIRISAGPVRVPSQRQLFWRIQSVRAGSGLLHFEVEGASVEKRIRVGGGPTPVSGKRPSLHIGEILMHPAEKPFGPASPVQSIMIHYPERTEPFTGSARWLVSFFIISMLSALGLKPFLRVKL